MARFIGIDLGGTNIKAGLVDETGNIEIKLSMKTQAQRDVGEIIADMAGLSTELCALSGLDISEIEAVGMGVPGTVDIERGRVHKAPNIGWYEVDVLELFKSRFNAPLYIENDANAAAVAEHTLGAARGLSNVLMVTLGTGIGGGIIANGRILRGSRGAAAEIGHMIIERGGLECNCGNQGCWEMYASARGLKRLGQKAAMKEPEGMMMREAAGDIEKVKPKLIESCARAGDKVALGVWEKYVDDLALGLSDCIKLLDPEAIVLGGGVANSGEFLTVPLAERLHYYCFDEDAVMPSVKPAFFRNDAGIIGAAIGAMVEHGRI